MCSGPNEKQPNILRRPQTLKKKIFLLKFDATRQILRGRFFQIFWPSQNIRTLFEYQTSKRISLPIERYLKTLALHTCYLYHLPILNTKGQRCILITSCLVPI